MAPRKTLIPVSTHKYLHNSCIILVTKQDRNKVKEERVILLTVSRVSIYYGGERA